MHNTRTMLITALFTALVIVGTFLRIPIPPVPISMQTFFVMLASLVLPPALACESILLFLFLGAIGVPVFSTGGGIGALFGPTGGFLFAMVFEALAGSMIADHENTSGIWRDILALLAGEIMVYAIGVPFLKWRLSLSWAKAFLAGMAPFLAGDVVKMAAALIIARNLRERVKSFLEG